MLVQQRLRGIVRLWETVLCTFEVKHKVLSIGKPLNLFKVAGSRCVSYGVRCSPRQVVVGGVLAVRPRCDGRTWKFQPHLNQIERFMPLN